MPESEQTAQLIKRCVAGEDAAWAEFISLYRPWLLVVAQRRCSDESMIDDLVSSVHEALLKNDCKALRDFGALRDSQFSTYLWKVAGHAIQNELRQRGVRDTDQDPIEDDQRVEHGLSRYWSPVEQAQGSENTETLTNCLLKLPQKQGEALARLGTGETYREMAKALDEKENNIKNLIHQGRKNLHRMPDIKRLKEK